MLKKRLIPIVLLKNGWVVQSKFFREYQNLGNPLQTVKRLSEWCSDELIYLDISKDGNYDIKRSDQNFETINDPYLINQIFEIENNEIVFLVSKNNIFAVRVQNIKTDNYVFNEEEYNSLNESFSKSFFNDFSNFFIQNLAIKHNLTKNYKILDNYFVKSEEIN